MLLRDALADLAEWPGIRVHRSYWVMLAAIVKIEPAGKSYRLTLKNGEIVPVSLSHKAMVAGLYAADPRFSHAA